MPSRFNTLLHSDAADVASTLEDSCASTDELRAALINACHQIARLERRAAVDSDRIRQLIDTVEKLARSAARAAIAKATKV